MTGAACQLGELTSLETNRVTPDSSTGSSVTRALHVLPFEAWQLVERGGEFDVNRFLSDGSKKDLANEQLEKRSDSEVTNNRHQTRSGSSDSGQLSLLSSFGSLSFAGFQLNSAANQQHTTNPSSDSISHQSMSVDIDQHQFYCSLMLLNSLDFSHYEHNKSCNNKSNSVKKEEDEVKQQASLSSKTPSLTLSQTELCQNLKSPLDHNQHKGSLQDCRSHWFPWDKKNRESNSTGDVKTTAAIKDNNKKRISTESDQVAGKSNKRGFGLGILGGSWQSQGATKLVATAAAATNSSTLVDKLLTHMISKRTGANNRSANSMSSARQQSSNKGAGKQQPDMTMNNTRDEINEKERADCGCPKSKNPVNFISDEQFKKQKATQSTGGIHLLSDLSRRLARRCGVKTKAVQFGDGVGRRGSPVLSGISNGVQATNVGAGGANNFKKIDSCDKKSQGTTQQQRPEQATCYKLTLTKEPSAFHEHSWQRTPANETETTSGDKTSNHKSINLVSSEAQQQHQLQKVSPTRLIGHIQVQSTNQERDSAPATDGNESNSLNQININSNCSNSGNFMCSRFNINASNSTLNTTPSNCCYWDNETCSSSGFVSSSTTGLAGRGGCIGSGSISFGCSGGVGGGNCGDSTTTTHSCNSSAYNEPIVTPPSPPPPNSSCCSSCAEMCSRACGGNSKTCDIASLKSLDHDRQSICQHHFSLGFEELLKLQDKSKQQDHQYQLSGAKMASASPAAVSAEFNQPSEDKLMTAAIRATTSLVTTDETGHVSGNNVGQVTTNIRVTVAGDDVEGEDRQENQGLEVKRINSDGSSSSGGKDGKSTHLKPKSSLLTRARNSTINLASLATVTNRLSSASVGNLWHGAGSHHHHHTGDLAGDSSEGGIQPLDYVTRGPFDTYHEGESQHLSPVTNASKKSSKSASSNKLLSVASCGSTRKVSTKEKCKRQKDAERVEKLRLLVNYLKSGSSQPVVSPVALEADEIELAERYKMHVILRDDILQDIQAGEVQQQQPLDSSIQGQNKSPNAEHKPDQANALETKSISLLSHSMGGTSASSPASSLSTCSVNQAHQSVHDGRSIPQIGNVTWVLRHSISDPGNNFQHLPTFSTTSSSSPSTKDRKLSDHLHHNHHHHHHHQNHHTQLHRSYSRRDDDHCSQGQQQQKHEDKSQQQPSQEQVAHNSDNYSSCAPSSSYSGSSLSNYCLVPGKSGPAATQQQSLNSNQQSPKMFYIDDMDMIPVFPSGCLLNVASSSAATPQLAPPSMSHQQTSTPLTTANSTNCCSQPSTPLIYANLAASNIVNNNNNNIVNSNSSEVACETESQSSSNRNATSGRVWTNPQNLATWIDNEVNSLVHDLEAKSQQLQIKNESKHNKSGKKKWLSVTNSHSSRRSSSGAQST